MKWSVLDPSPASAGCPQDWAIRDSVALAQACDALGYERFWLSEHHNSASIVGTAPEILIAARRHSYALLATALGLRPIAKP
jgi:alkanesulfonate monooxygenase SsuD/methylene tetrahydromethanopterin reductase-like flavin-dependent oxidoreductase (luciferase family)